MDTSVNDADAPLLVYENIDTFDIFKSSFKIDKNFKLAFNEKVIPGNGDIVISNGTDTRVVAIDDSNQVTFDESGGVIIDLAEDLVADTTYNVQMASGVITDTAGNAFTGFDITGKKTETSEPLFKFSNIHSGGSTFKIDSKIGLNFDEKVIAGSGDIIISNGVDTLTIPITDTNQVIFDKSESDEFGGVIIDPINDLIVDTTYSVQIDNGVITDAAGNPFAGLINPFSGLSDFNITTIGPEPLLKNSIPRNESIFKIGDKIRLTFDEQVKAGSGDIIFSNGTDTRIIAIDDTSQVTFDELGGVVIDLAEDLIADTTYNVQMASGVITDTIGNNYTGFSDAKISTIDSDPLPLARSFAFKNDGKISFYFDEKVKAGSGDIIFNNSTDTRIVAIDDISQVTFDEFGGVFIDLAEDLTADTTYNVQMASGVITDTADNVYAGFSNLTIGTFASNPLLTSARPGNRIELIFDEQVLPGDGDVTISNGTDTRIIAIDDTSQVTFDEFGGVIVDPSADLSKNTVYSMRIESEAIMDTDGNPYVGSSASSNLIPIFEHISYEPIFGEGHNSATSWLF